MSTDTETADVSRGDVEVADVDVTKVLPVSDLLALYMPPVVVALAERMELDLLELYEKRLERVQESTD